MGEGWGGGRCPRGDTHQGAALGLGELGGHEVLDRGQQNDDSCPNQGTDPEDVVKENHAHDDLRGGHGGEFPLTGGCSVGVGGGKIRPPPTSRLLKQGRP